MQVSHIFNILHQ